MVHTAELLKPILFYLRILRTLGGALLSLLAKLFQSNCPKCEKKFPRRSETACAPVEVRQFRAAANT